MLETCGQFLGILCLADFPGQANLAKRLEAAFVALGQWDGQPLGQEIIAGVAGGYIDLVGFSTQPIHILD